MACRAGTKFLAPKRGGRQRAPVPEDGVLRWMVEPQVQLQLGNRATLADLGEGPARARHRPSLSYERLLLLLSSLEQGMEDHGAGAGWEGIGKAERELVSSIWCANSETQACDRPLPSRANLLSFSFLNSASRTVIWETYKLKHIKIQPKVLSHLVHKSQIPSLG